MNWMTKSVGAIVRDYDDHCEHLEIGDSSYIVVAENDGMGEPERTHLCKECHQENERREAEELRQCNDCDGGFETDTMVRWRPYDFDPRQGDEDIFICSTCENNDRHVNRVSADEYAETRALEFEAANDAHDMHDLYDDIDDYDGYEYDD